MNGEQPTTIKEIADRVEQLSLHVPLWGIMWSSLAMIMWHIWWKRNVRWHGGSEKSSKLLVEVTDDLIYTYTESRYKSVGVKNTKDDYFIN